MIHKKYPYLQDAYVVMNENSDLQRRNFLAKIDDFVNQKQYIKVTLLNWKEEPLKEIEGELSTGTLTKDGSSAFRRTMQFTASVSNGDYDIENAEADFAINKKIFVEIGIKNYSNEYTDYPILWFPQGVFYISSFSCSSSTTSAVTLNIQLKDKMAGLNGDVGGVIPSTTVFDEEDTQSASGEYVTKKVLIYNIIMELVNHFGGEDINNIVIEDVDTRIKRVMQWRGSNPAYLLKETKTDENTGNDEVGYRLSLDPAKNEDSDNGSVVQLYQFNLGDDVGYIYDDFVWSGELTSAPGDTVVTVLDKIKSALGNYEYFYDEFGVFHFREIKNYLNTSRGKLLLDSMNKNDYLVEINNGKSLFNFSDDKNISSISVSPKYDNIKNDYVIHGTRKGTSSDQKYDIMYHLAIDEKPRLNPLDDKYYFYNILFYVDKNTKETKACYPNIVDTLPAVGDMDVIYAITPTDYFNCTGIKKETMVTIPIEGQEESLKFIFVYWNGSEYEQVELPKGDDIKDTNIYIPNKRTEEAILTGYYPKDWRTYLYLYGLRGAANGTDKGYYYAELSAFWPQIYDLVHQKFYKSNVITNNEDAILWNSDLTNANYYLDFIDPSETALGAYAVNNIGRRTDVVSNEDINCLFQPDIPDVVYINVDDDDKDRPGQYKVECDAKGQRYCQLKGDIYYTLATGGTKNGAFDQIKYELYLHTNYQRTLSLTGLPAFYLEPNTRVTVNDKSTNTYGDFLITNITLPLGPGSLMSVSCSEVFERF